MKAAWPFNIHRATGLGALTVGIAVLQELLARAAQRRLTWLDGGSAALTGLIAVRLLYQEPPPPSEPVSGSAAERGGKIQP